RADSNVPVQQSIDFAQRARAHGKRVTTQIDSRGDHYNSMIEVGIPTAIQWLFALERPQSPDKSGPPATSSSTDSPNAGRPIRPGRESATPARATASDLALQSGDRVEVQLGGKWEPAEFVERVNERII